MPELIEKYKIYCLEVTFKAANSTVSLQENHPAYQLEIHNPKDKPATLTYEVFLISGLGIDTGTYPSVEIQPGETKTIEGRPLISKQLTPDDKFYIIFTKKNRGAVYHILMSPLYLLYGVMHIYVFLAAILRGGYQNAKDGLDMLAMKFTHKEKEVAFQRQ